MTQHEDHEPDDKRHEDHEDHEDNERDDIPWIDFRHDEIQDNAYTPERENVRGPYLPDQVNQADHAATDDRFNTAGEAGLAEGGGSFGEVGAGTSGGTMGRGDTGHFSTMGGTDLSDTLGGPGAPDRTAGPPGTEPIGDIATPEVRRAEDVEGSDGDNQGDNQRDS